MSILVESHDYGGLFGGSTAVYFGFGKCAWGASSDTFDLMFLRCHGVS
jgi:hypothetical protein